MKEVEGLHFTVTNFKYNPGIKNFKPILDDEHYRDFMMYISAEIVAMVVNAIDKQRYIKKWKPLSINYLTYKQKHNLSLKIYEATGFMKEHIRVFQRGKFIEIGFDRRARYPKSYASVNTIARYLEFGSRDNTHPPSRPIWRPLHIYIRKNIGRYYNSYQYELKRTGKTYLMLKDK